MPPARATGSSLPSRHPPCPREFRLGWLATSTSGGRGLSGGLVPVAIVFSLSDEQGRPSSEPDPVLAKDRFLPSVDAQTQLTIRLNRGAVGPVGGEVIGEFRIEGCPSGPRRTSWVALTITAVGHDLTLTARDISSRRPAGSYPYQLAETGFSANRPRAPASRCARPRARPPRSPLVLAQPVEQLKPAEPATAGRARTSRRPAARAPSVYRRRSRPAACARR